MVKKISFSKKVLFNEISCGHVENCYDFSTEVEKKFAESRNFIYEEVKLTTRIFSLRFFYGHVEGFFDNTWRRFAEFLQKTNVFQKKASVHQSVPPAFYFGDLPTLLNLFCQKPKYFRSMSENDKNKSQSSFFFQAKTYIIELFLWTRRIELWKTCWFSSAH